MPDDTAQLSPTSVPRIGDDVRIIGLISEKASQYNGLKKGKVEKFHKDKHRYEVALEDTGSSAKRNTLGVKPENLQLMDYNHVSSSSSSRLKQEDPLPTICE
jgi:hypothetical protein